MGGDDRLGIGGLSAEDRNSHNGNTSELHGAGSCITAVSSTIRGNATACALIPTCGSNFTKARKGTGAPSQIPQKKGGQDVIGSSPKLGHFSRRKWDIHNRR